MPRNERCHRSSGSQATPTSRPMLLTANAITACRKKALVVEAVVLGVTGASGFVAAPGGPS